MGPGAAFAAWRRAREEDYRLIIDHLVAHNLAIHVWKKISYDFVSCIACLGDLTTRKESSGKVGVIVRVEKPPARSLNSFLRSSLTLRLISFASRRCPLVQSAGIFVAAAYRASIPNKDFRLPSSHSF
jgi:hypothetical protein